MAPAAETWKVVALTAIAVGALHGLIFWAVRRRRERVRTEAHAELETQVEKLTVRARRRTAELEEKTDQLRRLAARIQSAREEERARIAREVHDVLGQALTGLQFDVTWMAGRLEGEPFEEKLEDMSTIIRAMTRTVQEIATELRPGLLDEVGIVAALEWQTRRFERRTNIRSSFSTESGEIALSRDRSTALFRISQEALSNVARHAEAQQVKVFLKRREGDLILEVEDDGRGIEAHQIDAPESLGILGMHERAAEWGGELCIEGLARNGTRLTIRLPVGDDNRRGYHG